MLFHLRRKKSTIWSKARTGTALKLIEADQPWAPAKVSCTGVGIAPGPKVKVNRSKIASVWAKFDLNWSENVSKLLFQLSLMLKLFDLKVVDVQSFCCFNLVVTANTLKIPSHCRWICWFKLWLGTSFATASSATVAIVRSSWTFQKTKWRRCSKMKWHLVAAVVDHKTG